MIPGVNLIMVIIHVNRKHIPTTLKHNITSKTFGLKAKIAWSCNFFRHTAYAAEGDEARVVPLSEACEIAGTFDATGITPPFSWA